MELIQKNFPTRLKNLVFKIYEDNLFLLSSSISYYSAVAIAPFLLILLGVAAIIGEDVQGKVERLAHDFSPELGKMIEMIFANVNEGINLGSISGIIGVMVLFFTASLVFLQLRYSFDVIYGYHLHLKRKNVWETIVERLFAMFLVFLAGIFLIVSSSLPGIVRYLLPDHQMLVKYESVSPIINFIIYIATFWGIHYFTPTRRPKKRDALIMGVLSSVFFIIGNVLLGYYFKDVAMSSIYGAAASLLIFLIWTYYSSFTMFLSVELFLFMKKLRKVSKLR